MKNLSQLPEKERENACDFILDGNKRREEKFAFS
jgi:hypothetical protein